MAQAKATKEFNTFVGGLITEANPLTFPENASLDEDNFILNRNGSRNRRLGIDYEASAILTDFGKTAAQFSTDAVSIHIWSNVNDNPNISLVIVQVGLDLFFFDLFKNPITGAPKNKGNKLTIEGDATKTIQTTVISGDLVVASNTKEINVLQYNAADDIVTRESHGLLVRDIWGIDDDLDINERPDTLSKPHEYNLINQGWGEDDPDASITFYQNFRSGAGFGKYPSNADLVSIGTSADENIWLARVAGRTFVGSTPAPKGHFIIDLFERGGSRSKNAGSISTGTEKSLLTNYGLSTWGSGNSGAFGLLDTSSIPDFSGLPSDRTDTGITSVATFAGRVFYSGMESVLIGGDTKSPLLGSYIAFSQIVDIPEKIGMCFQEADPTSREVFNLIATDGGIIKIPEMSRCLKLVSIARSLIVIAENGVWEISGGEENFSATNFQVTKISNIGATSGDAVVNAEGDVFYWSLGGIYRIITDPVSQASRVENISETTIQTFFDNIRSIAKINAVGNYDSVAKKIQWLYSDDSAYDGVTERNKFNRILNLDLILNAFYPGTVSSVPTDSPYIADLLTTPTFALVDQVLDVVVGSDDVIIGTAVTFTITVPSVALLGFALRPNGTRFFVTESTSNIVFQYSLGTVNNISTSSKDTAEFNAIAQDPGMSDVVFRPNGTTMFMLGRTSNNVFQYGLTTAWDVSTASFSNKNFSVNTQDIDPRAIVFSADGTKMYMLGNNTNKVFQYSLSTAFDISTASFDSKEFSVGSQTLNPRGLFLKPDGTQFFLASFSTEKIFSYTMSTAFDISTASFDSKEFSIASGILAAVEFSPDGKIMFVLNTDAAMNKIQQFELSTAWDITTASAAISDIVVTQTALAENANIGKTHYLSIKPSATGNYKFTLSLERDTTFVDWKTDDGTGKDAPAFLETGYEILQDTQRPKQAIYLTTHFERTETGFQTVSGELEAVNPSSCLTQSRWDFSDSTNSGKFGTQFEAYRLKRNFIPTDATDTFDYGFKVVTTKNKIRGRGKALRLKFDTTALKDLFILGWGIVFTGNTDV